MNTTMKGIVKEQPAPGAVLRTGLPIPAVGDNDVLVKVRASAICGTDMHTMSWGEYAASRVPIPMVFGHEFSGDVVKVGKDVTVCAVGDRVAGETHIPCNHCYQCEHDNRHICENMKIIGVHVPGCFADYISIPQDCVYRISDSTTYEVGAMLEPMGVAVHGVATAEVKGKNVLVFGCGPIGLMAVGACKAWGAKTIIAADIMANKLAVASDMGANLALNSMDADFRQRILDATNGVGVDVAIDYTGSAPAVQSGLSLVRKGGRFVLVGLPNKPMTLDLADLIIYKEITMIGVTGRRMYETWEQCEQILASGKFDIQKVIGGTYPLEKFEEAFQALKDGCPGKMLLIP